MTETTPIDRAIADSKRFAQQRANETRKKHIVWLVHYASAAYGVGCSVHVRAEGDDPKVGIDQELELYLAFEPEVADGF